MILVTDAGGMASPGFCSYNTFPVDASMRTALLQFKPRSVDCVGVSAINMGLSAFMENIDTEEKRIITARHRQITFRLKFDIITSPLTKGYGVLAVNMSQREIIKFINFYRKDLTDKP